MPRELTDEAEAEACATACDDALRTARLGTLLSTLQSLDYPIETLAAALGDRVGWALVTLIEAWKCACRIRLACTAPHGELLRSIVPETPQPRAESLMSVVQRMRATRFATSSAF